MPTRYASRWKKRQWTNPEASDVHHEAAPGLRAPADGFQPVVREAGQATALEHLPGTLWTPKDVQLKDVDNTQYLIHGVGFDSRRVQLVSASAAAGYSTFRYDRLGTGLSEHASDSYNEAQALIDLAIATKLLGVLKDGGIGGQKLSKVVGVEHSYGSMQVQALSATVPHLLDGVLLQGFSMNGYVFHPHSSVPPSVLKSISIRSGLAKRGSC
ncbi:hypothetical protein GLOTRDRAFT_130184 [Gloeophyllum trabeum ATCC 11539]|uniref:AB hydrolase-1 domain-containing protein n=1 Tax=Gloeophyllum trabeum (strain ATCC 11539 / FP-39264 / Madison 617) TaxID=670483 RepID=S7RPM6_GLOTA|nr:uncharacterized protein GLOTRDRAFT_130184 [Gloeophyllum trabeum ATCC 11539]EPQ54834.1 hypothetical protein GLOTRDRAFT_130184 [Gloeophyllum trabeum ATCC 11539]